VISDRDITPVRPTETRPDGSLTNLTKPDDSEDEPEDEPEEKEEPEPTET
jgi:hypothetical protein